MYLRNQRNVRNQNGFTLIEIIAVLVILGILAAIAVPKYIDLQKDARIKVAQSALGALQSTATMIYAKQLLNGTANASSWVEPGTGIIVGDFTGSIEGQQQVNLTVTDGPNGWNTDLAASDYTKTFNMW
ncbi:MAG: prepilin-type cleavage/methylation domain-containing protein [Deltaproteobacteria bacterium HGW-Deltaproteobacteria-12]|nr:MAG: prepilin-type cleavage/methylation domain-containing protein [Deltaproteobacteria bacterium HGW-Deltaproteobacteria-12]